MKILIDADPICYRAVYSKTVTNPQELYDKIDEIFNQILEATNPYATEQDYVAFLTGKGNFRYEVSDIYKANRPKDKPTLLEPSREYIIEKYNAVVSSGQEADDDIATAAHLLYPDVIVVSIDKDLRTVPCNLYNPNRDTWEIIDYNAAMMNFYTQLLVGDKVDNIIGVNKIGPVTAAKILDGSKGDYDMWCRCLEAYGGDAERATMNGRLLWLRRYEGEVWQPPKGTQWQERLDFGQD